MSEDINQIRHKPENIALKHKQSFNFQERLAILATKIVGTMYAVYLILLVIGGWMVWQSIADNAFDPFPFAFLLFVGSVIQLPLMSLMMVGQNLQGRYSELRADEEFKTTKTIYEDIEKLFDHLSEQDKKLEELHKTVIQLLGKK